MITEQEIREALNAIVDPCSRVAGCAAGLNEMGLIRAVEIVPSGVVRVVIGVTEYGCLMGASFASEAYKILERLPGVTQASVELDGKFDWDLDDMSPDYRARLEAKRAETRSRLNLAPPSRSASPASRPPGRH
jgi:metal-sulfur cluster biosynthetic enzyme